MEKGLLYRSRLNGHRYQVPHHPEALPDIEIKDSQLDPSRKLDTNKKNLSLMYASLFATLYGGEVGRDRARDPDYAPDMDIDSVIVPDVSYVSDERNILTEVKSVFRGRRRPKFSRDQVAGLFYLTQYLVEQEVPNPHINIGIFTYGKRGETVSKLGKYDLPGLRKRLAQETDSLLILPFNLFLYTVLHHDHHSLVTHDHSSSTTARHEELYFELKRSSHNLLLSGEEGLQSLTWDYRGGRMYPGFSAFREKLLGLEDIVLEQREVPLGRVKIGNNFVRPFPIFQYRNPDSSWMHVLAEHGDTILSEMGLQTLAEAREEKKQRDLLRQAQQKSAESASSGAQEDDELPF